MEKNRTTGSLLPGVESILVEQFEYKTDMKIISAGRMPNVIKIYLPVIFHFKDIKFCCSIKNIVK